MGHANIDVTQNVHGRERWGDRVNAVGKRTQLTREKQEESGNDEAVVCDRCYSNDFRKSKDVPKIDCIGFLSRYIDACFFIAAADAGARQQKLLSHHGPA
ncbi:MAG: hypothetical protein WB762_12555 [Candidatus Sulfotelmatobacter sp.]